MRIKYDPSQEGSIIVYVLYSERETKTEFYAEILPVRKRYKLTNIEGENKSFAKIRHIPPGKYRIILRGYITELDIYHEREKSQGEFSQSAEVILKPNEEKVITFNLGSEISVEFNVYLDNQIVEQAALTIQKTGVTKYIKNSRPAIFVLKPNIYRVIIELRSYKINRCIKIEAEDEVFNLYISSQEIMIFEWNEALKKKSIDSVLNSAITLLEKNPDYPDINLFVGRLYVFKKDHQKAFIYFQSAIKNNSEFLDAYIYLSMLLIRAGYFDKSLPYLKKARELNPFVNDKCFDAAMEAIKMKRAEESEALVKKAFEYNPFLFGITDYSLDKTPNFINYTDMTKDYFYSGDLDKANKAADKLLKLQPNYVDLLYISGLIEYYRGNAEEAILTLTRAYEINNNYIPVLIILGKLYFKTEKHAKAQEYFFRVLNIDKENKVAKVYIAKIKAFTSSKPITEDIKITYN